MQRRSHSRRTLSRLALCAVLVAGGTLAMPGHAERADPQAPLPPADAAGPAQTRPATDSPPATRSFDRAPDRSAPAVVRSADAFPSAPVRPRQPAVDPQLAELGTTVAALSGDVERLHDDNERLQSANQRLSELNAQLRQEVESLGLELQTARASASQRWVLYGAGLVFIGLLTGVFLKARPRRSAWS